MTNGAAERSGGTGRQNHRWPLLPRAKEFETIKMIGKHTLQLLRRIIADRDDRAYAMWRIAMACRGIDLGIESTAKLHLSAERSFGYSNTGGPGLDHVLRSLPISSDDCALDVGCGKGGAIITMARFPFRRVDGVEISPKLVDIGLKNIKRLAIEKSAIVCTDAADFRDFDRYNFLYMFNPFPASVLHDVLLNVRASLKRLPRRLRLLYVYGDAGVDDLILKAKFDRDSTLMLRTHQAVAVYVSR